MVKYISILRGINVGGKRKILMADLKDLYSQLGFENIITYIQSGNVIFTAPTSENSHQIAAKIQKAISDTYGFDVPVIIRTDNEIKEAVKANPYQEEEQTDIKQLHLTFLGEAPLKENIEVLEQTSGIKDRYQINTKDIFICCEGKYSDSKLTNQFFEKKLKVTATTRNWKTVNKLLELTQ